MNRSLLLTLALLATVGCGGPSSDDFDGDGSVDSVDCAPDDPSIHPAATELCSDGIDNDCDSWIDCADGDCLLLTECDSGDDDDTVAGDDDDTVADDDDSSGDDDDDSAGDDDDSAASPLTDIAPQGITMIALSGGTFEMGCTSAQQADSNCGADESPDHDVTLTRDFWMGETEVTQGQWQALMGNNPSYFSSCGSDCPVEMVRWYEALAFANAVSSAEGLAECYTVNGSSVSINSSSGSVYDCEGYRLPTEAEWEYAARAGTDLIYAGSNTIDDVAWYESNSGSMTHVLATKAPNDWGLYDMSGNVLEWTWDWYDSDYYSSSPSTDPEGPSSGSRRVLRGGSWGGSASNTRVANRGLNVPNYRQNHLGFRLSRTIP